MRGELLLDTNIIIAFFANDHDVVRRIASSSFLVPCVVLGELYTGARRSARSAENLARIDAMIPLSAVVACDAATAKVYGGIKQALLTKGRPLPENDVWIAAIAVQYSLPIVTRDAHFLEIENLNTERW